MAYRFAPGCRCHCRCIEFDDRFTRSDDTDLGADWTEISGDWEIAGEALMIADADAVALVTSVNLQSSPDLRQRVAMQSLVQAESDGDVARWIWRWSSASHYYYVEVTFGEEGELRIGERSSGVSTIVARLPITAAAGQWYRLAVCFYSAKHITSVWWNGQPQLVCQMHAISTAAPSRCGLGTGDLGGSIAFDDYVIEESCNDVDVECTCRNCRFCGWPRPFPYVDGTGSSARQLAVRVESAASDGDCNLCANFAAAIYVLDQIPQTLSVSSPDRCVFALELSSPIALCPPEALYAPISRVEAIVRIQAGGTLEILVRFEDAFDFGIANYAASFDQTTDEPVGAGPLSLALSSGDSVCIWPATITIEAIE